MSMNLYCNQVELIQTPTWVTYACLMTSKGYVYKMKGKKARRALRIYDQWLFSRLPRVISGTEEKERYKELLAWTQAHSREVHEAINSKKKLTVYTL